MRRLSPAVQTPSLTSEVSVELRLLCLGDWLRLDLLGQVLTAASCPGDCGGHISFDTGCEKLCFDSRLLRPGGPDLKPDRLQTLMTTKPPSIIDHWPLCQETAPIYPTQCH